MSEMPDAFPRSTELLSRGDSRLLIIDMQDKLLAQIPVAERLIDNCRKLIEAADVLEIPVEATEQYPKGLGSTTSRLSDLLANVPDKLQFSCADVLGWKPAADLSVARHKVVLAGIEAHVCVQQTALDLLARGYQVYVAADAVGSRNKFDWKIALERMAASGATVTTTEAILFEWCEEAGTPEFKQISKLVTGR